MAPNWVVKREKVQEYKGARVRTELTNVRSKLRVEHCIKYEWRRFRFVCLFACLLVSLFVYLFVCLFVCFFVWAACDRPAAMQPGKKFMSELLIGSLMAEGSLESALEAATELDTKEYSGENGKEKASESKDLIISMPLLHLTQQLLRSSAAQAQAELRDVVRRPPSPQWPHVPPSVVPTGQLLLKLQRLLIGSFFAEREGEKPWYLCRGT